MAKLTAEEIAAMVIKRANFSNGMWQIVAMTPENKIYMVRFAGEEADADAMLLANTNTALLDVEKQEPPVLPVNVERQGIIGLNPSA